MVNIWIQDFGVLFDKKYLIDFIPRADMSYNEKINSLVRFSLYLSIILSIIKGNIAYLYIFILTLVMTYMFFMFNKKNEKIEQFSNNREAFSNNREAFSNNREQFSITPRTSPKTIFFLVGVPNPIKNPQFNFKHPNNFLRLLWT